MAQPNLDILLEIDPSLAKADADSRLRWSHVAAIALIHVTPPLLILDMVRSGKKEFIRVCRDKFRSHEFRQEDYERIWEFIRFHAARLSPNGKVGNA